MKYYSPLKLACILLSLALLGCLTAMPYGYYILVRFATMIIAICVAVNFYKKEHKSLAVVAGSVALLFQPFCKIILDRDTWHFVDVIIALALVAFIFLYKNE